MTWFGTFLYLSAVGIVGAMAAVPFKEMGRYFFKFNASMALGVVAFAVLFARPWSGLSGPPIGIMASLCALVFPAVVLFENVILRAARDLKSEALLLPLSVGLPYAVFAAVAMRAGLGDGLLLAAHFVTGAAAIGFTLVTMILGHWYLQNAALSFGILRRMTLGLIAALAAKAVVSGIYVAMNAARYASIVTREFDGMLIAVRVGVGLVVMLVLAGMAYSCAKIKANQSATGILYVATIFILIGELDSLYLTLGRGLPV